MSDHDELREWLGSYALGHLSGQEAGRLRGHLDGCPECRAELAELGPVVAALGALDAADFDSPPTPPPGLGEDIRALVTKEREARDEDDLARRRAALRRRRLSRLQLGGAAAVIVLVGVAGGVGIGRATAPQLPVVPKEPVSLTVTGKAPMKVENAYLVNHTWGTELRIAAAGFPAGKTFQAWFKLRSGETVPAGEFVGTGASPMTCNLQSAAMRAEVVEVVVTNDRGVAVLSSPL